MGFAKIIIVVLLAHYSYYILSLFFKSNRKKIVDSNKKLERLRSIPVKTLEEQKEFLNVRYPKKGSSGKKFSWKSVIKFLGIGVIYISFFLLYNNIISFFGWNIKTWHMILFVLVFPYVFNTIMRKFGGLQKKSDISVFFR